MKTHPNRDLLEKLRDLNMEQKEQLLVKIEQDACDNEMIYHGCCRSVLSAFQSHLGLGNGATIQAATALGGGVARTGEACGALLGGLMAIGLAYASATLDDSRASPEYQETMDRAMKFADRFKKEFGTLRCCNVHKALFGRYYDARNPEDLQEMRASPDHTKCADIVARKSARLAAEVILERP